MSKYTPRLKTFYREELHPLLKEKLEISNDYGVPRMEKIVVTSILGRNFRDSTLMEMVEKDLGLITGQKPVKILAVKSVAAFSLRKGMPLGWKVTLRGSKMYEFFDRMVNISLPQVRTFSGVSLRSMDGKGNISIGFSDYATFPEIGYRSKSMGLGLTISTNTTSDYNAAVLLHCLGLPFNDITVAEVGQKIYPTQSQEYLEEINNMEKMSDTKVPEKKGKRGVDYV